MYLGIMEIGDGRKRKVKADRIEQNSPPLVSSSGCPMPSLVVVATFCIGVLMLLACWARPSEDMLSTPAHLPIE